MRLSAESVPTDQREADESSIAASRQLQRGRQPLDDRLADGLARPDRAAEVALQRPAEPDDVLDRQRLIQPERCADLGQRLRVALLAGVHQHRIARRQSGSSKNR